MNLNQLRVFESAARLLNFTRAAEELHLTQPGISKHLKELEAFYGTPLFDRLGKRVVLTQAGEALLEATSAAFHLLEAAKTRIADLSNLTTGKLAIGASVTIGTYILPDTLVQFRQRYPGVEISVEAAYSRQIAEKVLDNSLELGLVGHYSPDSRLEVQTFMTDRLVLVVSPVHPWAQRESVRIGELEGQTLLSAKQRSGTWRVVERLMAENGVQLGNTVKLGTSEGVKRAIEANLGISILSGHILENQLRSGTIKAVPLAGIAPTRDLYLVHRKDRYLSRAARAFVQLLSG